MCTYVLKYVRGLWRNNKSNQISERIENTNRESIADMNPLKFSINSNQSLSFRRSYYQSCYIVFFFTKEVWFLVIIKSVDIPIFKESKIVE